MLTYTISSSLLLFFSSSLLLSFSPLFDLRLCLYHNQTDLVMRLFSNKYEMEPAGHANTTSSTGPCLKDASELSCETIGVGPGNMEHLALAILGGMCLASYYTLYTIPLYTFIAVHTPIYTIYTPKTPLNTSIYALHTP